MKSQRPSWHSSIAAPVAACSTAAGRARRRAPRRPRRRSPATPSAEPSGEPVELTVFGAASLKGALEAAKAAYEAANPGTTVTISTDSSAALETQIEQGAPADVFLSADTTNPQKLVDGGFADGEAVAFAGNKLTIIVPTDNPAGLAAPFDLGKAGVASSPPATRSRSRSTRRSSSRTSRPRPAPPPTSLRVRSERRLEGGQRRGGRHQDRARRGRRRASSTSPMRPRPTRSRRSTFRTTRTSRRPTPASS